MGRKSLAEKLYKSKKIEPEKGEWLVIYDFLDNKASPNFWSNMNRLRDITGEYFETQYSVHRTRDDKSAAVAFMLVNHYGGEAEVFRVERVDPATRWPNQGNI